MPPDGSQGQDVLLTTQQAYEWIAETYGPAAAPAPKTLNKLRCVGGGPEFVKIGNRDVAYWRSKLGVWVESRISRPLRSTSEAA